MTDAEIRKLWQQHGGMFDGPHVEVASVCSDGLLAFARSLIAAERERSAKICDQYAEDWGTEKNDFAGCAAAIRATEPTG